MATTTNTTKVVTGIVRLSYANVWEPASINGSKPKYSVSLIIPKGDTKTIADINAAINHGKQWNGYKLVEGRSNRKYTDESAVIAAATAAGYRDIFKKSLIPITEMEKLMGKKTFAEVLGGLVIKPQGKPTLVPASDKRPAIHTGANHDFNEFTEE